MSSLEIKLIIKIIKTLQEIRDCVCKLMVHVLGNLLYCDKFLGNALNFLKHYLQTKLHTSTPYFELHCT